MNDPITIEDLSAFLDDELPDDRRAAVIAALASDDALRAAYDALAWTAGVVAAAPLPEPPSGWLLRLPAEARATRRPTIRARWAHRPRASVLTSLAALLALAAGLAAAVATGRLVGPGAGDGASWLAAGGPASESAIDGLPTEAGAAAPDAGEAAVTEQAAARSGAPSETPGDEGEAAHEPADDDSPRDAATKAPSTRQPPPLDASGRPLGGDGAPSIAGPPGERSAASRASAVAATIAVLLMALAVLAATAAWRERR